MCSIGSLCSWVNPKLQEQYSYDISGLPVEGEVDLNIPGRMEAVRTKVTYRYQYYD